MKKLIFLILLCMIPNLVFANKIQGTFSCEAKHRDGSQEKFSLKINGKKMIHRRFDYDLSIDYEETYYSEPSGYTIFIMPKNTSQGIIIVSLSKQSNKIIITDLGPSDKYDEYVSFAVGSCYKI